MEDEVIKMEVVNPQAAGIDVGSRSHWVAVGQREEDVREYGVFNDDLFSLCDWLKESKVRTIAMESTGTYWQNLYAVLISRGFHVILCNGKFTKNIKGKKTDIKDCQWIQRLHSLGLLSSSFLPDGKTEELRTYCRHRQNLLHESASTSKKMQKYLRLLNLRLDVVVKDTCGLTGLRIIRAICNGEKNPEKLAELRHHNCHTSKADIARALQSNGREDYLFALQHELDMYEYLHKKIEECDLKIEEKLNRIINDDDNKKQAAAEVVIASMLAAALAEYKLPLNMIWVCAASGVFAGLITGHLLDAVSAAAPNFIKALIGKMADKYAPKKGSDDV